MTYEELLILSESENLIVKEKNIKVKTVEAGQRINIENNLYFDVLWPSR